MQVVKPEENHDLLMNEGKYSMHEKFMIIVLATYQSEEDTQKLMDGLPHVDQFVKYIVKD